MPSRSRVVAKNLTPIETDLEGIGHILRDQRLTVPPYQRAYSWELEQVSDFWWDLRAAFGSSIAQYFLGTVVLTVQEDDKTTIIDGQQRLATTALLFTALRNEFRRRGDNERAQVIERDYVAAYDLRSAELVPRLELNPDDQELFASLIFDSDNGDTHADTNDLPRTARTLRFFEEQIANEARTAGSHWAETLFHWVEFLEHRARVITVEVSDEADAFLIFETLNARGRELTVADLLKNYLFGLARDDLESVQSHWIAALAALEASADEELFTTFVRHLWSSMHGATRERELYSRMKAEISSAPSASAFAHELEDNAGPYAALLASDHPYWSDHASQAPIAETLLRLGLEQNRPLLLAALRRFSDEDFEALLELVVSWSVRGLIVGGIGGGTTERAYAEAAVLVTDGAITTTDEVYAELTPIIPTDEAFETVFAGRRINRTRIAKYLLVALVQMEQGNDNPLIVTDRTESAYSLKQLMPRRAGADDWDHFTDDDVSEYVFRLGNQMVIDEEGRPGPATDRLPDPLDDAPESWTPEAIDERQRYLASLAPVIWPRRR